MLVLGTMDTKESGPLDSQVESASGTSLHGFDEVAPDAIGGRSVAELPRKYYSSLKVIGSVVVRLSQARLSGQRY